MPYHRHSYTGCKAAVSRLLPQAALIADVNDIARNPMSGQALRHHPDCRLVFAAGQMSAHRAAEFPSGQWVPDEVLTNSGRRLAGQNIYREYEILADSPAESAPASPPRRFMPVTAHLVNKYIMQSYTAEETHRVRMMEDRLCDSLTQPRLWPASTAAEALMEE